MPKLIAAARRVRRLRQQIRDEPAERLALAPLQLLEIAQDRVVNVDGGTHDA
jgi:hypothetical protein